MTERWAKRRELQHLLVSQTRCTLQHTGWPCNRCFFARISDHDDEEMWHAVLVLRGDYKHGDHGIDMPDTKLSTMVDRVLAVLKRSVMLPTASASLH